MLSIVVPTLNEAAALPGTISHARSAAANGERLQWIVSDCDSRDDTLGTAKRMCVDRIVTRGTCRADALNRGAAEASGQTIVFLHADSLLPSGFDRRIAAALGDPRVVGGAFDFEFGPDDGWTTLDRHLLRWVVLCNRVRYRWTGNFYGDQSIFVRRDVFDRIGGFPRVPILEDVGFSRRMRRAGRTAILRPPAVTSPRRFLARGVVRQFLDDLALLAFDSVGLQSRRACTRYSHLNRSGHGAFHPSDSPLRWAHATT